MPTITLQVGQCGNQLGQQLWKYFDLQASAADKKTSTAGCFQSAENEFFHRLRSGRRQARCILVDTEPKVVSALTGKSASQLFSLDRCFVGQSGRGNNWAYGYSQLLPSVNPQSTVQGWDNRTHTLDTLDSSSEAHMLAHVMEGVRRESERCDTAPNFLMLHSLGGGSGSGLGSRLLEEIRQEYPLNYLATVSVAPRSAGDSPMQSLNSVMALSFLQAYSDAVILCSNDQLLNRATRQGRSAGLQDLNQLMAHSVLGALWPLDAGETAACTSRIRDMVCTVATDPCLKLLECHTALLSAGASGQASWQDGFKAVAHLQPRFDPLSDQTPVVISSALVIGRGLPASALSVPSQPLRPSPTNRHGTSVSSTSPTMSPAVSGYVACVGGAATFACPADVSDSVQCRHSAAPLAVLKEDAGSRHGLRDSQGAAGPRADKLPAARAAAATQVPAMTCVANTSGVIGLLDQLASKAQIMCDAGAYMHWYERYGCSTAAVQEAVRTVQDMADAYRLAHGVRDCL